MNVILHRLRWIPLALVLVMFLMRQDELVKHVAQPILLSSLRTPQGDGHDGIMASDLQHDEKLPDWRIVTDCSVYSTDCATHAMIHGRYKEYPFKLTNEGHDDTYGENLTELPTEWISSLKQHEHTSNQSMTAPRIDKNDYYLYPPQQSEKEIARCMETAENTSLKDQIDLVLKRIGRAPDVDNMVSFTISDYNYAVDMMHEVFEMAADIVGFPNAFFMMALDRETVELACRYGYPIVVWPGALGPNEALVHKVANSKFEMSKQLVERKVSFFFFEMDVFFIQSPKPWLLNQTSDIIVASHQNNPMGPNIGVFGVVANDATREYFQKCLEWSAISPSTHDQWVFSEVWWASERIKKKRPPHFGQNWDPAPENVKFRNHVKLELWGPHDIVSSEWIVPTEHTIAVHPLCGKPLQSPHGKKITAKELGAWYGFRGPHGQAGYYHRTNQYRRYLWLDGRALGGYSTVQSHDQGWGFYHNTDALRLHIAIAVCLARRTKRIFVLPKLIHDRGVYVMWNELDLQSLEGLVEVRETNFPSNPKSWYSPTEPFRSVARTALGQNGRLFAEYPLDTRNQQEETVFKSWKTPNMNVALDAFFALATAIPKIDNAEALLINPHFMRPDYLGDLMRRSRHNTPQKLSAVEQEIMDIYRQLKWCNTNGPTLEEIAAIAKASTDCYGNGIHV